MIKLQEPSLDEATKIIAGFEGFRAMPYLDSGSVPTIGYGIIHYPEGTMVTMHDKAISKESALAYLKFFLSFAANRLWIVITRQPRLHQWSAMLSLAYNEGATPIAKSTLIRLFNEGNDEGAANQFLVWDKLHVDGQLVVSEGLENRRRAERALYLSAGDLL